MTHPQYSVKFIARFWSNVDRSGSCWNWKRCRTPQGYGKVRITGHGWELAPRICWKIIHGHIPNGLHILHKCDNPPCVNPEHLFLGTILDNARDRETKGRGNQAKGEKVYNAKLNTQQIASIRQRVKNGTPQKTITEEYKLAKSTVSAIIRRKTWKHVP